MKHEFIERIAQVIYDGKWFDADRFTKQHFRFKAKAVLRELSYPPKDFVDAFQGKSPVDDFSNRFENAIETTQGWPCGPSES